MSLFTIRVELHNASWNDYLLLAQRLAARGIVDVIQSDEGVWYKLPPAEYNYEGNASLSAVQQVAGEVASSVSARFALLVSECAQRGWQGLQVVKASSAA